MKKMCRYILLLIFLCGCSKSDIVIQETIAPEVIESTSILAVLSDLNSGDAKFYGENIITSVAGFLHLYDQKGNNLKIYEEISSNWIDTIESEGIVIYGNLNKQIGIAKLDAKNNLISHDLIMESDNLQIDPTINKIGNTYYITVTEIEGNVNNASLEEENGTYTLHMYTSENLKDWDQLTDVISIQNNIEDVDVFEKDGIIYVTYEKEVVDKGLSGIYVKHSEDNGSTWSDEIELLESNYDQEPAAIYEYNDGWLLYYSSDKNNAGESYMGGEVFYALYDSDFRCKEKDVRVNTETKTGILLYDVAYINGKGYLLIAKDYLTSNSMVIESTT